MSDKLFEYKDPQDWYIAQWGEDADYNQFSQVPAEASTLLDQLELLLPRILKDSSQSIGDALWFSLSFSDLFD